MKILAGSSSKLFAQELAKLLNIVYIESHTTSFNDTETRVQILEPLFNENLIIVQSTSRPVNDRLIELLLLIDSARRAKATKINLVIPYFGYSRQDRNDCDYGLIPARLVAHLLETAGVGSIVTIDLHSSRVENFFSIPVQNLNPVSIFLPMLNTYSNLTIVAPDSGSSARAFKIAKVLNIQIAQLTKNRTNNNCEILDINGDVEGKNCIIVDDIIDSGETICVASKFLINHGALSVNAFVTHAVLSQHAKENIQNSRISNIYVTNSIEVHSLPAKFHVISAASIVAEAITTKLRI